jgi:hypothetical protein
VVDASDVVVLISTDISIKVLWSGLGVLLDLLNISVDTSSNLLLDVLELSLGGPAVFKEQLSNDLDGVSVGANFVDLLSGSVGDTGVRHGVTMVTIGDEFDEQGTVAINAPLLGELNCLTNNENVLAIDFESWDEIATSVELSVVRSTLV